MTRRDFLGTVAASVIAAPYVGAESTSSRPVKVGGMAEDRQGPFACAYDPRCQTCTGNCTTAYLTTHADTRDPNTGEVVPLWNGGRA